jgi:DNA-binding LacI/PurR family transcriptional regulator
MMAKGSSAADRPTMEMVAALAGVSKITVSRALRGSDLVRPEVRERIAGIARDAGYRMNVAARSLRTRQSKTIAVVIEQLGRSDRPIADPLLLSIVGGLLESLTPSGYSMLLTTNDHFLASNAIGADGAVMLGQGEGAHRLGEVAAFNIPMVAWGEPVPGMNVKVIGSDNHAGGKLAAEHLLSIGRKRLLFLGDTQHPEVAARLAGFREALAASEAMLVSSHTCPFTVEGGKDAVRAAITNGVEFDSIFAASDYIAAGACDALAEASIEVPRKVAIVGFDDAPIASSRRPSISSVRQDGVAAGHALGETIISLVEGLTVVGTAMLPVEVIARETSATA